ncbi:hypothetical protein BDR04DRAFT_1097608 [Suillus decipiens]|nr:hypothetical protein BDR04DRAFT_1097608 [Suillus decipiens]
MHCVILGCVVHSCLSLSTTEYLDFFAPLRPSYPSFNPSDIKTPSLRIKDFVKNFDLSKVFAVRLRRGRATQCSSTNTHHDGDCSIPTNVPMHIGSLARDQGPQVSSSGDSCARKASDVAQAILPFVQDIAGAIPFAGPPMQAAISGLLSILQAIDVTTYFFTRKFLDSKAITET